MMVRYYEGFQSATVEVRAGLVLPFLTSATGKMFLARSNPSAFEEPLRRETAKQADIDRIFKETKKAGVDGVDGDLLPRIPSVSAPVFDHDKSVRSKLENQRLSNSQLPHVFNDWLSLYAMVVNEENAAGGQVVTSPTNGAADVVPAVIRYYQDHCRGTPNGIEIFLFTAAAIGGIIKHNASISGAECGCQAEVGSVSSMAAASLCAELGGSNEQIEMQLK